MNFLEIHEVSSRNPRGMVLDGISFSQKQFQNIAIAGETGSGKSTLLKIVAGIMNSDTGAVYFKNERLQKVPEEKLIPGHHGIAYLSQQFDLPHFLRVEQVLEYASELTTAAASIIFGICDIQHLLKRRTDQLSGGEKQRIALARLLISSPSLLVLDEPFSNLDLIHKNLLKKVINDLSATLGISCMMVSHDPLDSLPWADNMIILKEGRIVQQGNPIALYNDPVNEYVGGLLGNYYLLKPGDDLYLQLIQSASDNSKSVFIRPENIYFEKTGEPATAGIVKRIHNYGSYYEVEADLNGQIIRSKTMHHDLEVGDEVAIKIKEYAYLV